MPTLRQAATRSQYVFLHRRHRRRRLREQLRGLLRCVGRRDQQLPVNRVTAGRSAQQRLRELQRDRRLIVRIVAVEDGVVVDRLLAAGEAVASAVPGHPGEAGADAVGDLRDRSAAGSGRERRGCRFDRMRVRRHDLELHVVGTLGSDDLEICDAVIRLGDCEIGVALQRHRDRVLQVDADERILIDADEITGRQRSVRGRRIPRGHIRYFRENGRNRRWRKFLTLLRTEDGVTTPAASPLSARPASPVRRTPTGRANS